MKDKIARLIEEDETEGFGKVIRSKGWLHKDDPVKGLRVERECEHRNYNCAYNCKLKLDTCIEKGHPLTVGEALDMLKGLLHIAKQVCKVGCIHRATPTNEPLWACKDCWIDKHLTTKDGGRIVKEE